MDLMTQHGYTWPTTYPSPLKHQVVTSNFLVGAPRSFCLNGIGSAKTLAALWSADFLMIHKAIKKVLVVTTLSTVTTVWVNEIWQHMPHRTSSVLHGTKEQRLQALSEDVDFYIINHDGIKTILHELHEREDISMLIVDEGAEFKNSKTDKWKALNYLAGSFTHRKIWWLTGSPMPVAPTDVWAQAKLVNPELVPKYFTRFRDEIMVKCGPFRYMPVKGWEQKCFRMLQPSIRFKTEDCIDLPPVTTQVLSVDMSPEQKKAYKDMLDDCMCALKEGTITAVNEAARRIKLAQLASGAVYNGDDVLMVDCKPKVKELLRSIAYAGNKAIVYAPFRHSVAMLKPILEKAGLSVRTVIGGTPQPERAFIFDQFQKGNLNVLLATPGCLAHGLTLTASHVAIWWAPVDGYRIYEQANGRIRRPGQKHKQTIIHLMCSAVEAKMYKRLANCESMQGVLLELLEEM